MNSENVIQRTTSKRAKKAYAKRQPGLSEKEKRQIARSLELDRRADAIKEKERRKKENARKRDEKEAKQREERRRMGISEPVDNGYVSPRQTRMEGFFGRYGNESRPQEKIVAVNEDATDDDEQETHPCLENLRESTVDPVEMEEEVEEEADDDWISDDQLEERTTRRVSNDAAVRFALPKLPAPVKAAASGVVISKTGKRKRQALSRTSSAASAQSQPMRLPLRTIDTNLCVDKREIWVPPSQNTVLDSKRPDMKRLKTPLPDLPWPKPAISSPTLAYRTQRHIRTEEVGESAGADRPPHDSSLGFSDFDLRSSQLEDLECLARAVEELGDAETPLKPQEDIELPVLPNENSSTPTGSGRPAGGRQVVLSDVAWEDLAELLSEDTVLGIDQVVVGDETNHLSESHKTQASHLSKANSGASLNGKAEDDDSKADPVDVGSFEFRSSDFSPLDLTQILLPPSVAEEQDWEDEDEDKDDTKTVATEVMGMSELDEFGISTAEADALERAALHQGDRPRIGAVDPSSSTTVRPADRSEGDSLVGRQDDGRAQARDGQPQPADNISFGFGDFDFSSQEVRSLERRL